MDILELKDICVTYKNTDRPVYGVDGVSFSLKKGESIGIVGESGSGKTTLVMSILRLLEHNAAVSGQALFNGKDILPMDEAEFNLLRWKEISAVFQKSMSALSPVHRVGRQFESVYRVHSPSAHREEIKGVALELFRMVNLGEQVYSLYPHELSGGMLQRVSIALCLLFKPSLIFFDEATTGLDMVTRGQMLREIKKLEDAMEITRLTVTHDMAVVAATCDKVGVMYAGRLMEVGGVREVIKNPGHPYTKALIQAYPNLHTPREILKIIPGSLPDLGQKARGCVFAPRCGSAQPRCVEERPALTEFGGRMVSCHYAEVL